MQKTSFKSIVSGLLNPLIYLNLAGMAAAALWLGLERQWQVIWIGVLMLIGSPYFIPIVMIPAGVFAHFMGLFGARGQAGKERLMFALTLGYLISFAALWFTVIFDYVMSNIEPHAAPVGLLWACTSALLPLLWWASRDRSNTFIVTLIEVAQLAVLVPAGLWLKTGASSFWPCFFTVAGVLAAQSLLQALYEKKFIEKK